MHNASLQPSYSSHTCSCSLIWICKKTTRSEKTTPYHTSTFFLFCSDPIPHIIHTCYPRATRISTSLLKSSSAGDPASSISAAGLLAKSSRSNCLADGGVFVASTLALGKVRNGSPNCNGASSSSSSSSEML